MKHGIRVARVGLMLTVAMAFAAGCAPGTDEIAPPEIRYGEDICIECGMIISDPRFAAAYVHEIEPGRYESVAFDDLGGLFAHAAKHPEHEIVAWYVHDHATEAWIDARTAHYVSSPKLRTPMGHGTAAHATLEDAEAMAAELDGELVEWADLEARFSR